MSFLTDLWYNAAYGTLSPSQKAAAVANEAQSVSQASGGAYTPDEVTAQANSDITAALTSDNADPSQASFLSSAGFTNLTKDVRYLVIAFVALVAIYFIIRATRR